MSVRVLCLLANGLEEIETIAPVDILRRAGAEVVMASIEEGIHVLGRSGIALHADTLLQDVDPASFQVLFIPGGPGVKRLREDGRAATLARSFADSGKVVAAICAAPTVLQDAKLLEGRRFTAHFSVYEELPGVLRDQACVEDGLLLTGRGAGVAVDFGLLLVKRIFGERKAEEVSKAIMR